MLIIIFYAVACGFDWLGATKIGMNMTSYCLIILSLICPLPCMSVQASKFKEQLSLVKIANENNDVQQQIHDISLQHTENGVTTDHRSWKGQTFSLGRHHVRNAHGILNIIGWGTLLPIGVIIARFFRNFPMKYDEWYILHVLCQTLGYLIGTIGWGVGLWLGNSSKHYTLKTHRILGILVFTFATIQILSSLILQPRRGDGCRKCWEIVHQFMGYTVIALSVANIFQGIIHQSHADKWKWVYVGILAVLAFVAATLEMFRWIFKSRIQQQMATFDNNINNFT